MARPAVTSNGGALPVVAVPLETALCDRRDYKYGQLHNGVRFLAIQDTDTVYAAACANIQCGYFDDPADLPGAAHFLEHMVHLGSIKYPDEREYKQFLAQHGGSSNASTSMVHTTYHFKVHSSALQGALDRFAAMLCDPLISPGSAAREVENVHAEYSRNTNIGQGKDVPKALKQLWHQYYRAEATCVAVIGPKSPDQILQWLTEAFQHMPSSINSNRSEPVEICSSFSIAHSAAGAATASSNTHCSSAAGKAMGGSEGVSSPAGSRRYPVDVAGQRGLLVQVKPQRDLRELELSWYLPCGVMSHSSVKPWQWASHLLGHEGPGSAAHLLKSQGLVQSLDVGMGEEVRAGRGWMFWRVAVSLTDAGERQVEHVVATIFRAIQVLEKCSDQQVTDTWREAAGLAALRFNWQDSIEPLAAVQSAAYALHYYAPHALLSGPRLMRGPCDPPVLRWFLQQLSVENVNIFWSSKRHAAVVNSKECWYGAEYAVQRLPEVWLDSIKHHQAVDETHAGGLHCLRGRADDISQSSSGQQLEQPVVQPGELHLPEPNWALPQDLVLRQAHGSTATADPAAPQLAFEQPGLCVWHKLDTAFGLPKIHLRLHLVTPQVYFSPETAVASRLLVRTLGDVLMPRAYPAELAGSSYSLSSEQGGLLLKVTGFPQVAQQLLLLVLKSMTAQLGADTVQRVVLLDLFVQLSSKAAFHELRTRQRLGYSVSLSNSSLHRQLGLELRIQSPNANPDAIVAAARLQLAQCTEQQLADAKKALQGKYLDPAKSLHEAARRAWVPIHSRSLAFDRRQDKADAAGKLTRQQLLDFYDDYLSPQGQHHKPRQSNLCSWKLECSWNLEYVPLFGVLLIET
eukprot:gene10378-10536_t